MHAAFTLGLRGHGHGMYELVLTTHFAAAHNLRDYEGSCERLHGHNWQVDVHLRAERLNNLGMVIDFRELKAITRRLLDELDHRYLNELAAFETANPTTENVARWIFDQIRNKLPDGVSVHKVTAWESQGCGASYMEAG